MLPKFLDDLAADNDADDAEGEEQLMGKESL